MADALTKDDLEFLRAAAEIEDFELIDPADLSWRCEPFVDRAQVYGKDCVAINQAGALLLATFAANQPSGGDAE